MPTLSDTSGPNSAENDDGPTASAQGQKASPRQSRSFKHLVALAFLGTVLASMLLILFSGGEQWAGHIVLTALVVFPSVAIVATALWLLKGTRVPEYVTVLSAAVICGVVAGLIIFSAIDASWYGLIITVPVAVVVASIGFSIDDLLRRRPKIANIVIVIGAVLLLASILGTGVFTSG